MLAPSRLRCGRRAPLLTCADGSKLLAVTAGPSGSGLPSRTILVSARPRSPCVRAGGSTRGTGFAETAAEPIDAALVMDDHCYQLGQVSWITSLNRAFGRAAASTNARRGNQSLGSCSRIHTATCRTYSPYHSTVSGTDLSRGHGGSSRQQLQIEPPHRIRVDPLADRRGLRGRKCT